MGNTIQLEMLNQAKRVLVLAVGGGNDSVSTLLLQKQLQYSFNYYPEVIDIVAVLPDCLDYQNLIPTDHELISIIDSNSTRSVNGYVMNAFPERILSQNKTAIPTLPINNIYGFSMNQGSIGISNALFHLITKNNYDLILAIDVGGDFIAVEENIEVLSPMMDGYMLYSLKYVRDKLVSEGFNIPMLYSVFGLGTDGESTPEMLMKALSKIENYYEGTFYKESVIPFVTFYRNIVEPNRYSRTTDYTINEILGITHPNPSIFRGRFHVKQSPNQKSSIHYGNFEHLQDECFFGKFYLFDDISNIKNLFSTPCKNGIEWFLNIQNQTIKFNHELNGQSYNNLGLILNEPRLNDKSLFFGTPSRKFTQNQQKQIVVEIENAIANKVYDFAIIYSEYQNEISPYVHKENINNDLVLIGHHTPEFNILLQKLNYN